MRYVEFRTLLEYDRSKTVAALGSAILQRANSDAYLKSITANKDDNEIIDTVLTAAEQADPTTNKQYVVWIVRQFTKNKMKYEDLYKLNDDLAVFFKTKGQHKRLGINSDINQYSWQSLADTAAKLGNTELAEPSNDSTAEVADAQVLYNGPLGTLSIPKTEAASCALGSGTKWCTAARDNSMFDQYNSQGPLYVWNDKKRKKKYQFHFESGQFMDPQDRPIAGNELKYLTTQNPVTSKLFKQKSPSIIKNYVEYLQRDPDDDEYDSEPDTVGEEILDTDIAVMISAITFDDAVKLIKPALRYSDESSDNYQLIDALIKRFERNNEIDTVLEKHNNYNLYKFSDQYRKYKLSRAPKEQVVPYILANQDDPYAANYALRLAQKAGTRILELEPLIAKDPQRAYSYAYHVLKQQRFKSAEPTIATDSWAAANYATKILKQRWPDAEAAIQQSPFAWKEYKKQFGLENETQ